MKAFLACAVTLYAFYALYRFLKEEPREFRYPEDFAYHDSIYGGE